MNRIATVASLVLLALKLSIMPAISWLVVVSPILISIVIGLLLLAFAGLVAVLVLTK